MGLDSPAMVRNPKGTVRLSGIPAVNHVGVRSTRACSAPRHALRSILLRSRTTALMDGYEHPPAMERLDASVTDLGRSPEAPALPGRRASE